MAENRDTTAALGEADLLAQRWQRLPGRIFAFLISADILLVLAYAVAVALGLAARKGFNVVNLDLENNPADWFSSAQYLVAAIPFLAMGLRFLPEKRPAAALWRLWLTVGAGLMLLSLDEGASLHERLGRVARKVGVGISGHGGAAWIVVYLAIGLGLVLLLRADIVRAWREWRPELLIFAFGFVVLILGGGVFETIGHVMKLQGTLHFVEVGVEEGLEMFGVSIMALASYRVLSRSAAGSRGLESPASASGESTGS